MEMHALLMEKETVKDFVIRIGDNMLEYIVTVDEMDREVGAMEKIQAHKEAVLHRAFSVIVRNSKGEILLQQRYHGKYHSPGLWTNTCCSHQRVGETLEQSIHRRMKEEMGFDCEVREVFHFLYKAEFDNQLTEHEIDHVFIGEYDGVVHPDPMEVENIRWMTVEALRKDMKENPDQYTVWFQILMERPEMELALHK